MKTKMLLLAAAAGVVLASLPSVPAGCAPGAVPVKPGAAPAARTPAQAIATAATYKISGPFSSGNLSVYLIHGADQANAGQYVTLQEALQAKQVVVHETGDVNELSIENKGNQLVFIQSGDIVKGGRQDRAVQFDLVLPPRSGKVPLTSFCVEQGRWSPRGKEVSTGFSSSTKQFVAKEMKLAAKMPYMTKVAMAAPRVVGATAGGGGASYAGYGAGIGLTNGAVARTGNALIPPPPVTLQTDPAPTSAAAPAGAPAPVPMAYAPQLQGGMWNAVSKVQGKLQRAAKKKVTSDESESSLQLTLENDAVKQKGQAHINDLSKVVAGKRDVIGYAFAINGKVNSADVYASNALFLKLWPKLLDATATEAVSEEAEKNASKAAPAVKDVRECLVDAERAKPVISTTNGRTKLITSQQTQDNKKNVLFETQTTGAAQKKLWVHRNYITK